MRKGIILLFVALSLPSPAAQAGNYRSTDLVVIDDNFPFPAFMIVHAPGYTGTGGVLTVDICVTSGGEQIVEFVDSAIALWNARTVSTANCTGCSTLEEPLLPEEGPLSLKSVLAHELGHCAFGLGHSNDDEGSGSFTTTRSMAEVFRTCDDMLTCPVCDFSQPQTCSAPSVPGDEDDFVGPSQPSPNAAEIIHWFEADVNNPFVISSPVLTRRRIDRPPGHNWPVNANRITGLLRGFPNAQAMMYSAVEDFAVYSAFTADDVATVTNAEAGLDRQVGTADDYSVQLVRVDNCADADVEIRWVAASTNPNVPNDTTAFCDADAEEIPGQTPLPGGTDVQHYELVPFGVSPRPRITANSEQPWLEFTPVFVAGFETGDFSEWSAVVTSSSP